MPTNVQVPQAAAPQPAVRFSRGSTTGDTVTVACKLPHGMILRLFDEEEYQEPQRDGTFRTAKRSRERQTNDGGELRYVVKGTWYASAGQAFNGSNSAIRDLLPGGYALTEGIPKDFWDEWVHQNRKADYVKSGTIFAAPANQVRDAAIEKASVTTGMEPLNPAKPAERMPGGVDRRLRLSVLDQGEGTLPR